MARLGGVTSNATDTSQKFSNTEKSFKKNCLKDSGARKEVMAHLEGETSNALFDTLAEWNDHLKPSDLKGHDEPKP